MKTLILLSFCWGWELHLKLKMLGGYRDKGGKQNDSLMMWRCFLSLTSEWRFF